ncbi:MAG: hypothetical protein ACYC6M_13275 [Terriglobales bacterium]
MKRIAGWRLSGLPLANGVKVFAGLIPYQDPDELRERRREAAEARAEAREERKAIQAEIIPVRSPVIPRPPEIIPPADDRPHLAAKGWYRVGETFYRVGSGPLPRVGAVTARPAEPAAQPARVQGMLF